MNVENLQEQLARTQATVRSLQEELAETNRGLIGMALELEERLEERDSQLRAANSALDRSDANLATTTTTVRLLQEELAETNRGLVAMTLELEQCVDARTAELKLSEQRKSAILQTALDCVIGMDREGRIIEWNPAAEKTFGYTREQALSQPLADLIIPPRLREVHWRGLKRFLETGEGPMLGHRQEMAAMRADGTEFPVELAIASSPKPFLFFTVYLRDITERKRADQALRAAQKELQQHAAKLEGTVAERTASLHQSLRETEALLYSIAHDLRAPNRAMEGFAQILRTQYGERLDERGRLLLDRIAEAATKNDELIRDLLEYGRLIHVPIPRRSVPLGEAVQRCLETLSGEINACQATVEVAEVWPEVWANDTVLRQIIRHLLSNALKFAKTGEFPRIRLLSQVNEKTVRLCVEDDGVGVPPEQQETVFRTFQRLGQAGTARGTGMGLAIVRLAAERMGGGVGVVSRLNEGSCFWVELVSAQAFRLEDGRFGVEKSYE